MLDILALQTTSQNPVLIMVVYNMLLSFILSTMIAVTYEKNFRAVGCVRRAHHPGCLLQFF